MAAAENIQLENVLVLDYECYFSDRYIRADYPQESLNLTAFNFSGLTTAKIA